MRRFIRLSAVAALVGVLAGCENDGLFDGSLDFGPGHALGGGVAYLERESQRLFFLEVEADRVDARVLAEAEDGMRFAWVRYGPDPEAPTNAFVLAVPEDERETDLDETLMRIDPVTGSVRRYAVRSYFGATAFDPNGRYLVLHHQDSDAGESGGLFNPNEVAIVDLQAESAAQAVRVTSLEIAGRTIRGVSFVDPLEVDGSERRIGVFLARGAVKLVDLLQPDAGTVTVKLVADDDPRVVTPRQVIARAGDEIRDPMIFIRASGTDEVYAISLVPRSDDQPGFWATLNQLDAGSQPRDMVLVEDGDAPMLVIANDWTSTVVDIDTADAFTLHLQGAANHLLLRGGDDEREVVLYDVGRCSLHVSFLEVDGLAEERGGNLDELHVPDGVQDAIAIDEDRLLLVSCYSDDLVLLDLEDRSMTVLSSGGYYGWSQAAAAADTFFIAQVGSERVVFLDLDSGHPESLVLDEPVDEFHALPEVGVGMVLHQSPTGRATLFPLGAPAREAAVMVDGFWLAGLFDDTGVPR